LRIIKRSKVILLAGTQRGSFRALLFRTAYRSLEQQEAPQHIDF